MKKLKFISIALIFCCGISNLQAQNRQLIDSLLQVLETSKRDTNKVNTLLELGKKYKKINSDSMLLYFGQAAALSKNITYAEGVYNSNINIAAVYFNKGDYKPGIKYYEEQYEISKQKDDKKGMSYCLHLLGVSYQRLNFYHKAIEFFKKSLELDKELNDRKGISLNYNNIGINYQSLGFYDKAVEYFLKSLKIKEEANNKKGMASSYNNIGVVFEKQEMFDKAIEYYGKALEIAEELDIKHGISICLNNIGNIYYAQGEYEKAIVHHKRSLEIGKELNSKIRMGPAFANLGRTYNKQGLYEAAMSNYLQAQELYQESASKNEMMTLVQNMAALNIILADSVASTQKQKQNYLKKAIDLEEKSMSLANEIESKLGQNQAAYNFMRAYKKLGNYKKALEYASIYIETQDSLFSANKTKAIQEMETKYETEKKNVEIQKLKIKDIENQNMKKMLLVGIGFLLVISVLLVFFFRQKNKSNKLLNQKNNQLKKLNETQSRLMSIISHDLKAPLSAFFSITSSLKAKIGSMDKAAIDEYFNRMLNSALAVKLQLENLLVWSIAQSTEINVNKSNYNLAVLMQKVIVILEEFSKEKVIEIKNNIDENIEINTDGRLLSIVLNNLTANGIKFSGENSSVEISAKKDGNKTRIVVKDYGCGISNENLATLFEGKNSMQHAGKGTGLGLIVCKDIVEKLGGKLWAESEEGAGTTFYIEIDE